MIILQSYLSQEKNNQGWHSLKNNLFSWVVSFFQAKEFYNEITLQTDAFQQLQSNLTIVIDDYLETIKSKSY